MGCPVGNNTKINTSFRSNVPQHNMWNTFVNLVETSKPQQLLCIEAATSIENATSHEYLRLWRGVQAIAIGCIPAHALYFSMYEATKHVNSNPTISSAFAGAAATLGHDIIMTPLDTIKQRLQLGHYEGKLIPAFRHIYRNEGLSGFFRSFPITLFTNIPYGIIMVSVNDFLRSKDKQSIQTCLLAGSAAGCVASAVTTPLDRIKTRLQTQALTNVQPTYCEITSSSFCPKQEFLVELRYRGVHDAWLSIYREEGVRGFFRGIAPRVLSHTPAVAISWTAYEMAKTWLA